MYRPDRGILRKIREYDKHLFVEWNARRRFFEIWRRGDWGRKLVLHVTRALYEPNAPMEFTPLDERILGCLYEPWGSGSHLDWYDKQELKELEDLQRKHAQFRANSRALGREMWQTINQRFVTTHARKNSGRPTFNHTSPGAWIRPDVQSRTSTRLFKRSAANAKAYGYRGR